MSCRCFSIASYAVLAAFALSVGACGGGTGSSGGGTLGDGQDPDPVVVDFSIAYVMRLVLFDVNGDLLTSEVRSAVDFHPGAELSHCFYAIEPR